MGLKSDNMFKAEMFRFIDGCIEKGDNEILVFVKSSKKFGCTEKDVSKRFDIIEKLALEANK
jgi:hypothetical protein